MKPEDFIGPACQCIPCHQAGVTDQPLRRDPYTGAWLHGEALRRLYEAREKCLEAAKKAGVTVAVSRESIAEALANAKGMA